MNKFHFFLVVHFKAILTILIVLLSFVIYGKLYANRAIPIYESIEAIPLSEWLWAIGFSLLIFMTFTYASYVQFKSKKHLFSIWSFIVGLLYAAAVILVLYGYMIYGIYVAEPLNPTVSEIQEYMFKVSEIRSQSRLIVSAGTNISLIVLFVNSIVLIVGNSRKEKTVEDKSLVSDV
jgi:hypothetical protein